MCCTNVLRLDALLESLLEPESSLVENKGGLLSKCGQSVGAREVCCLCRVMCGFLNVFAYYRVGSLPPIETLGEKNNHSFNRVN